MDFHLHITLHLPDLQAFAQFLTEGLTHMAVSTEQLTIAVTQLSTDIQDLAATVETEAAEIVLALQNASGGDSAALQVAIDEQVVRLTNLSVSAQEVRQRVANYIP